MAFEERKKKVAQGVWAKQQGGGQINVKFKDEAI
jgi:hypothetical protein